MAKRQKVKSELQILKEERVYKIQKFEIPDNEEAKRYTRVHHYMLTHPNFKYLSSSAKVVLIYMKDWAFSNEQYVRERKFPFSSTMLSSQGIMSNKTTKTALEELQFYGFIQKENNAIQYSGMTQEWSFISDWYRHTKPNIRKPRGKKKLRLDSENKEEE